MFEIELFLTLNLWLMLNWIVWKRTVFDIEPVYICLTESFEIEMFICIKINWALITYNGLYSSKPNQTPTLAMDDLDMTLNSVWRWGSSLGALRNVEYAITAITLGSILIWSGSTCWGLIDGSNRTVWVFNCVQKNIWCWIELFV